MADNKENIPKIFSVIRDITHKERKTEHPELLDQKNETPKQTRERLADFLQKESQINWWIQDWENQITEIIKELDKKDISPNTQKLLEEKTNELQGLINWWTDKLNYLKQINSDLVSIEKDTKNNLADLLSNIVEPEKSWKTTVV